MNQARLFEFAWNNVKRIPTPLARGLFALAADVVWLLHGKSVRRLEGNLTRALNGHSDSEIRRLSRKGMRSYLRYYCEVFQLPTIDLDALLWRGRHVGGEEAIHDLHEGRSISAFLAHSGNWDMGGAIITAALAPLTTVAERLKPESLFNDYVRFRTSIGLNVIALDAKSVGGGVFRELVRVAKRDPGTIIALLADRDLTDRGVEVLLNGHRARVAAGPAALCVTAKIPLYPVHIRYERLSGERRRKAKSPWGVVYEFGPRIAPPTRKGPETVRELTQQCVDFHATCIAAHPEDWHMMQRVFVDDLDPTVDAAIRAEPTEGAQ